MKTSKKLLSVVLALLSLTVFMVFSVNAVSAPKAPEKVTATSTTSSITLNWSAVKGASGYRIYYKTAKQTSWKKCVSSTTKTTHTFSKPSPGKVYTLAVRSYTRTADKSVVWGKYTTVQAATKPVATSKITVTQSDTEFILNWEEVPGVTHYRIYEKVDGHDKKWQPIGYTTDLTYKIKFYWAGTKHHFAVRSYYKDGSTLIAGEYRTIETSTPPQAPSNVKASATLSSATVTWKSVSGVSGYRVYYRTADATSWQKTAKTTKTSIDINNLSAETEYIIIVKAYIKTEAGDVWSDYNTVKVTTLSKEEDKVMAVTDGGLKLYKITSSEAKANYEKWGDSFYDFYETKNHEGKILIYAKDASGWFGNDINGALYDSAGNLMICHYCGIVEGMSPEHCDGSCHISFS